MILSGIVTDYDKFRRLHVLWWDQYGEPDHHNTKKRLFSYSQTGMGPITKDGFKIKVLDTTFFYIGDKLQKNYKMLIGKKVLMETRIHKYNIKNGVSGWYIVCYTIKIL